MGARSVQLLAMPSCSFLAQFRTSASHSSASAEDLSSAEATELELNAILRSLGLRHTGRAKPLSSADFASVVYRIPLLAGLVRIAPHDHVQVLRPRIEYTTHTLRPHTLRPHLHTCKRCRSTAIHARPC